MELEGEAAAVTSAEARFERGRRRAGWVLAPLAFAAVWVAPLSLEQPAHRLAAILAAVIVLWITEAIPMVMTAFLGVAAAVVLQVAPAQAAFAPFADPLVFLFIGAFMIAQAIFHHGLNRRFAMTILGLRIVAGRPARVLIAYAGVTAFLSMWISNTATCAMMLPIGVSVLGVLAAQDRALPRGFATALLLSTAFAASIGGLGTPVGTPPNLIGIGFIQRETGTVVPFFTWTAVAFPVVVVLLLATLSDLWGRGVMRDAPVRAVAEVLAAERAALGPWTRGQLNTLVAFAVTVVLWVLPGFVALVAGQDSSTYRRLMEILPEGPVALIGAGLLFVLPVDWRNQEFTLPWREALKIDWWIVFLYGGGIALGTLAFKTGLAEAMGFGLTNAFGVHNQLALLALATTVAVLLSETTSNTASANMIVPVVIAVARSAGVDPVLPAVGATLGASLGFMLPVSTPTNALVYGTGRIRLTAMIRHGLFLDFAGVIAIIAAVGVLGPLLLTAP